MIFRVVVNLVWSQGLGFRVQGLGFRAQGLGLRALGLGFRFFGWARTELAGIVPCIA